MDELRVAIIGYGLAGSVFHAPLVGATPGLVVASIVTGNPERAAQATREHPGADVLATPEDLWRRAIDHDLVVVAAPNDVHASLAGHGLDAGLAVVVDKPLAVDAERARDVVERADELGLMLTPFHNRRWDSDQLTLRRLIADGTLGEVRRYESHFERWRPELKPGQAWRETTTPEQGGGVLLDLGTHLADQALHLFGPAERVYAEIAARRGGASDDDCFVALRHASGVLSHLHASLVAPAVGPRLRVQGSAGGFEVAGLDGQEDALRAGARPVTGQPWGVEPPEHWGHVVHGDDRAPANSEPGDWPAFYAGVERALREGGPPPVDPRDAVAVLEVLDAARRSSELGSVVALG